MKTKNRQIVVLAMLLGFCSFTAILAQSKKLKLGAPHVEKVTPKTVEKADAAEPKAVESFPIATVNGQTVGSDKLSKILNSNPRFKSDSTIRPKIVKRLVEEELLTQLAAQSKSFKEPTTKKMVVRKYLDQNKEGALGSQSSKEEVEKYYQDHQADFVQYDLALIFKRKSGKKEGKDMKEIVAELDKGKSFVSLAKEYSDDKASAKNGGLKKEVTEGRVPPEVWEQIKTMRIGSTSEIIETKRGEYLVQVQKKETLPLTRVEKKIASKLRKEKKETQKKELIARLRAESKIEIDESALASITAKDVGKEGPNQPLKQKKRFQPIQGN
jgi:parvulin-like peptidyl-prolyl isomerase